MKPLLFVYNPFAGKGAISHHLSEIIQIFTSYQWICVCYPTQKKGDARDMVARLGQNFCRIVCAGGDGTLSEVAEGLLLLQNPPPLAYIPFGSTNDSANTLHLPRDPLRAAHVAASGRVIHQDTGSLNGQPFIYVAAFGAFASVSYEVSQDLKNTFGNLAYVMGGMASLPSISSYHLHITYEDDNGAKEIDDDFFYGMVCNSYTVGGLTALSKDAVLLDDGAFEVVLIRKSDGINAAISALQSFFLKVPLQDRSVLSFRAKKLTFTSDVPIPWTIDGEFGGASTQQIVENHQQSLTVVHGK